MKFEGMTFGGETINEIIFQTKNVFLQFASNVYYSIVYAVRV